MKLNFIVGSFLLVQTLLWSWGWLRFPLLSEENGAMENYQAILLFLGIIPCLWAAVRAKELAQRILCGSLALHFVSFIVLEVDTRQLDAPLFNKLFNGRIRDLWLGSLWLIAGMVFLRHRLPTWRRFMQWLSSQAGRYMLAAGVLWLISGLCDKLGLFPESHHFLEELLEVNACVLMLISAFLTFKGQGPQDTAKTFQTTPLSHRSS